MSALGCHTVVIAHEKLIGPPAAGRADDDAEKARKEAQQEYIPWRIYPSAIGRALPPHIAKRFSFLLRYQTRVQGRTVYRELSGEPSEHNAAKMPLPRFTKPLTIETGLATIMATLEGSAGAGVGANEGDKAK